MKAVFEGIQTLFVDYLFKPFDWLRALELKSWWAANFISWTLMAICACYFVYWCLQLKGHIHDDSHYQDTTAHSFFDK